jgi:hypothetical protein
VAYRTVVITTAVLLGLYVLARQVTLPVVQHRDAYQPAELAVKAAEALALAVAILQTRRNGPLDRRGASLSAGLV